MLSKCCSDFLPTILNSNFIRNPSAVSLSVAQLFTLVPSRPCPPAAPKLSLEKPVEERQIGWHPIWGRVVITLAATYFNSTVDCYRLCSFFCSLQTHRDSKRTKSWHISFRVAKIHGMHLYVS